MIVTRFRSVGFAAGAAIAAIGCYMVSLNVAAERNELARVERGIARTKSDIRYLQTELGTRSRLSELERWNVEVLALQAPGVGQYARDQVQLASLAGPPGARGPMLSVPPAPATSNPVANAQVVQAAYEQPAPRADPAPTLDLPAPAVAHARPALVPAAKPVAYDKAVVVKAAYIKPATAPALRPASLLDDGLLNEIGRKAASERGAPKPKKAEAGSRVAAAARLSKSAKAATRP